ncbi:MAG TPA: hypothetical protein VLE48_11170, partial [Terriglobales bacterium]|nr:hypothetical protein [Terriglobales bacterium]
MGKLTPSALDTNTDSVEPVNLEALGSWLLAFGSWLYRRFGMQLLRESGEHSADLCKHCLKPLVIGRTEQPEILRYQKMALQFAGRSHGDLNEPRKLSIAVASTAFSQIRFNRNAATPNLAGESVQLLGRELARDPVDGQGQFVRGLPDSQVSEIPQCGSSSTRFSQQPRANSAQL